MAEICLQDSDVSFLPRKEGYAESQSNLNKRSRDSEDVPHLDVNMLLANAIQSMNKKMNVMSQRLEAVLERVNQVET